MIDAERFWAKVDKSGECWEWTGAAKGRNGYGSFGWNDKIVMPHRLSYVLHHPITIDLLDGHREIYVCHKCDNRLCVNPSHLFLGTHTDNMKDMIAKGRGWQPKLTGEKHGMVKLTEDDVREIRTRFANGGLSHQVLGDEYGVSRGQILRIVRRLNWKHI